MFGGSSFTIMHWGIYSLNCWNKIAVTCFIVGVGEREREDIAVGIIQYIHLIPVPDDRTSANARLYKQQNISQGHQWPALSLRIKATFSSEVIHASMPRKLIGNLARVVYFAQAVQALSAGIKCRHCISDIRMWWWHHGGPQEQRTIINNDWLISYYVKQRVTHLGYIPWVLLRATWYLQFRQIIVQYASENQSHLFVIAIKLTFLGLLF